MKRQKKILYLRFLDHAQISGLPARPIMCEVFGYLIAEDKEAIYLASWLADDTVDENTELYVVLKSTIKQKRVLK